MNQNKLDKIISRIKTIKEESVGVVPTNASNSSSLGFDPETETPPVKKKKKVKYIYQDKLRSWWRSFNTNK